MDHKTIIILAKLLLTFSVLGQPRQDSTPIEIEEIYLQKEVPGTQESPTVTYLRLHLEIAPNAPIIPESIVYEGMRYTLQAEKTIYSIDLAKGTPFKDVEVGEKTAVIFYRLDHQSHSLRYREVPEKAPIYLP